MRGLLVSMQADVPPPVYAELKALARATRRAPPRADADRLRTALRRVSWEPLAELAPPPRMVDPAEATTRTRPRRRSSGR